MKKSLTVVLLILALCSITFSQSGWYSLNPGTNRDLYSVCFVNPNTGYASGKNVVLKTTNAGASWDSLPSPSSFSMWSIWFTDLNTGFIAGAPNSGIDTGIVLKTTNGGNSWTACALPVYKFFGYVKFLNQNTGFVCGVYTILKTTDAGNTWVNQTLPAGMFEITAVCFTDANTGYATELSINHNSGRILKTTNGGDNWSLKFTNSGTAGFVGVCFADANTGVAAGGSWTSYNHAIIFRTTDAGNNWSSVSFPGSIDMLYTVRFIGPDTAYIVGGKMPSVSSILKTIDGGVSWVSQSPNTGHHLIGTWFTDNKTGYATGLGGALIKTTDGGTVVGIEPPIHEIPASFELYQNYPNPFNPATAIKYYLPEASFVTLKVYDMLGRETAVLINEHLNPGSHEINWDAAGYPSGVYFYKLTAGSWKQTKKMILIK